MGDNMNVVGYVRVSTKDQVIESQIQEIKRICDYRKLHLIDIFEDKASGKNTERPGFQKMMKALEVNSQNIEAVIVYKLDRLGRSLLDLINITTWFKEHQIGFISITNSIDTTTKEGRLFFYMMAALGEYERELIIERTHFGLQYAKEQGRVGGRPIKKIPIDLVNRMLLEGVPKTRIAKQLGVHISTLYNKLEEERLKGLPKL